MNQVFNQIKFKYRFHRRYILLLLVPVFCFILFTLNQVYFIGAVFLILTAIQMIIKVQISWLRMFGVEIGYFFTILMGFMYGPKAGLVFGGCYVCLHWVFKMLMEPNIADLLVVAVIVPLMGLLAGVFSSAPLLVLAMGLTIFHIIGVLSMEILVFGELNAMCMVWPIGELIFMYLMINLFGPIISIGF